MNSERLLRLAELLRADAANPEGLMFDLNYWARIDSDDVGKKSPAISCGTMGCALGLAVLSGEFGNYALVSGSRETFYVDDLDAPVDKHHPGAMRVSGYHAAQKMFGISYNDAIALFSPDAYILTEGQEAELAVAQRIEDFAVRLRLPVWANRAAT